MAARRSSLIGASVALAGAALASAACAASSAHSARAAGAQARCAPVSVISARGTTEPQSGSKLLKPVGDSILARSPGATYTELVYPAAWSGGSANAGVAALVKLLNSSAAQCPDQRYVLLGYSQGATVVGDSLVPPAGRAAGKSAGQIAAAVPGKIAAVVLYGNPRFNPTESYDRGTFDHAKQGVTPRAAGALGAYASRLQDFCNRRDLVCQTKGNWGAHLGYFGNGTRAEGAAFALERLKG
jgi:hypothetical protein